MKSILISCKSKECANIFNLIQSILVLKTMPKCDLPTDVYIYCTKDKKSSLHYSKEYGAFNDLVSSAEHYSTIGDGCGKVVAKFTLRKVGIIHDFVCGLEETERTNRHICIECETSLLQKSCLTKEELYKYGGECAWHIDDLVIFDNPMELNKFEKAGSYNNPTIKCNKREQGRCNYGKSPFTGKWIGCEKARLTKAPRSWCYIEEVKKLCL